MKHIRILSTALIVLSVAGTTAAQAQRSRSRDPDPKDQHAQHARPDQHAQDQHDHHDQRGQQDQRDQQRRTHEEQQRNDQYRQHMDQQAQLMRQRAEQMQQARRAAQYRAQQDYAARLRMQQQQLRIQRNYANDQFIRAQNRYRYNMGGVYHQTNQYGADMLRQAVNNGYVEGVRAGQADRQDRWPANFEDSPVYRDANYGYNGSYVDQSDYNYYFRQGFQRGYEDGYNSRSQYGNFSNGSGSILGNILSGILGLQSIP